MTRAAQANTANRCGRVLADSGYKSEEDFIMLVEMGVDAHVALGRGENGRMVSKRRKVIVEPPSGWIQPGMDSCSFSMRGLEKVTDKPDPRRPGPDLRRRSTIQVRKRKSAAPQRRGR
jgi:hypothetical protein